MSAVENVTGLRSFTAGEDLAISRRVKLNSSQQVVYADADDEGIGITQIAKDSGEVITVKMDSFPGTRKVTVGQATDAGDYLTGMDNGKVGDVPTTQGPALYIALTAGSADGSVIEAVPLGSTVKKGLIYANIADSAEVENTTDETAFDKSKTIDGGQLRVGDVIEVEGMVRVNDSNSTDTLECKLYFGTEVIIASGATDVADADLFHFRAKITIRVLGASGKITAMGIYNTFAAQGTAAALPFSKAEATEDISADVAIQVKATWSVAHADNEAELEQFVVLHHRQ